MDLEPTFVCCWGCPVALAPVAGCVLASLIALGAGGVLQTKAGLLARGIGLGLSVVGLFAGLVALCTIVRFGIAWEAGWSIATPEFPWTDLALETGRRHPLYNCAFAIASLVAMIVAWLALPRIVAGGRASISFPRRR